MSPPTCIKARWVRRAFAPPATVGCSVDDGAASGVFSQEPGDRQAPETTGGQSEFFLSLGFAGVWQGGRVRFEDLKNAEVGRRCGKV